MPVEIPKESQKEKQKSSMMATCRLPEEETAGESLSGKPAPFRAW